jgi:hypothetical protein
VECWTDAEQDSSDDNVNHDKKQHSNIEFNVGFGTHEQRRYPRLEIEHQPPEPAATPTPPLNPASS